MNNEELKREIERAMEAVYDHKYAKTYNILFAIFRSLPVSSPEPLKPTDKAK